jgi:hypothetical protein
MASGKEKPISPGEDEQKYVPVFSARDPEEAERYRDLFEDHDIAAVIGSPEDADAETEGVPVLVPWACQEEAREIIADLEDSDVLEVEDDLLEEEEETELGLEGELDIEAEPSAEPAEAPEGLDSEFIHLLNESDEDADEYDEDDEEEG